MNVLIIAILVVVSMLVALGTWGLVTLAITDFQFGEYFKGIINVLVILLTIFYLILLWIGIIHRLY